MTGEPTPDDLRLLGHAIELSRRCPPSRTAYSVGAVLVDGEGAEIGTGWSRDAGPHVHAEESALRQVLPGDPGMAASTLYSTLEPCAERRSGRRACVDLVLAAGIGRVVIAWREPPLFVPAGHGVERLRAAGVTVVEVPELARAARAVNAHLPGVAG